MIRYQANGCGGIARDGQAGQVADRVCAVHVLAVRDAGTHRKQQLHADLAQWIDRHIAEDKLAIIDRWLDRNAVDARRFFGVAEPDRVTIDDA